MPEGNPLLRVPPDIALRMLRPGGVLDPGTGKLKREVKQTLELTWDEASQLAALLQSVHTGIVNHERSLVSRVEDAAIPPGVHRFLINVDPKEPCILDRSQAAVYNIIGARRGGFFLELARADPILQETSEPVVIEIDRRSQSDPAYRVLSPSALGIETRGGLWHPSSPFYERYSYLDDIVDQ